MEEPAMEHLPVEKAVHQMEEPVETPAVPMADPAVQMTEPVDETPPAAASPPNNNGGMFSWFACCMKKVRLKLEDALSWPNLLETILKFILRLVVSTAFALFISFLCWLIYFHPHTLHPEVDSAVLVAMELGGSGSHNALQYNLALNVSFVNKYSMTGIQFKHLTAALYYGGAKISPTDDTVPSFKLGKEATRTLSYTLRGQAHNVSDAVAETYTRERAEGLFNVNVAIRTMLTYRFFPYKMSYYYRYNCWLQFPPVPGDGTPGVTGAFECGRAKSFY